MIKIMYINNANIVIQCNLLFAENLTSSQIVTNFDYKVSLLF
jgi:hypothetical protein